MGVTQLKRPYRVRLLRRGQRATPRLQKPEQAGLLGLVGWLAVTIAGFTTAVPLGFLALGFGLLVAALARGEDT